MKICMLGSGSLGSALGGVLSEGGNDVWLVDAWAGHVDAMNARGLTLRDGGVDRTAKVKAATTTDGIGPVDLVVVLVKSFHTREAIEKAGAIVGPATVVMSLQNGLGHEEILADVVGRERVLAGKTYAGGVLLGPGHVIAGTRGKHTIIGELDGRITERAARVAETFSRAGLPTEVSANITGAMWDKLLINVATGALSGITRLPYGGLYNVPEVRVCALAAIAEGIAVAKAHGVTLTSDKPEDAWVLAGKGLPKEFKASILQSIEKGAPTEIDFINGSVVRWGERARVPTPVNRALVACVKGIELWMKQYAAKARDDGPALGRTPAMPYRKRSYVEHVAVRVRDIGWHVRFFREVFGMPIREVDGLADNPRQIWTVGGVQLIADPGFLGPEGRLAHLGVMTEDLEAALAEAYSWSGVTTMARGRNWLALPDGLCVEVIQATGNAVAAALAVDPRA
jgi:2-dehydropantoate 2-reductase